MGKKLLLCVAFIGALCAGDAWATGNIKPGQTVHSTFKTTMDAPWDTTISVTSSTLDTLQSRGFCSYIQVCSATASMSFACRAVGAQGLIPVSSSTTKLPGVSRATVDYDLTTFTAATGEYLCTTYGPLPSQQLYGVIIDGQATGSVYIRFEP